jgi:hypothetical protein
MLDFDDINVGNGNLGRIASELSAKDLMDLSNEMVDTVLELITDCDDDDVVFVPEDPKAYDPAAATSDELYMPWTLGHVIVHVTASSEESAALAAELARGVMDRGGRSRSEVPWTSIKLIDQCRQRLAESRRIRLASLEMWPDEPYLENTKIIKRMNEPINATGQFLLGLIHEYGHLNQIRDIISQAKLKKGKVV